MSVSDLYPPELRADVERTLGAASSQDGVIHETVQLRKDGVSFAAEASTRLIDAGGRRFFQSIVRDITDRKQAEEALAAEKERLAVTLRSIGDAVIATDVGGTIVLLNNVAERLTGWTQDEAVLFNEKARLVFSKAGQSLTIIITPAEASDKIKVTLSNTP